MHCTSDGHFAFVKKKHINLFFGFVKIKNIMIQFARYNVCKLYKMSCHKSLRMYARFRL